MGEEVASAPPAAAAATAALVMLAALTALEMLAAMAAAATLAATALAAEAKEDTVGPPESPPFSSLGRGPTKISPGLSREQ